MRYALTFLQILLFIWTPVFAEDDFEYIIQQPLDTCATRLFKGRSHVPIPGINCPSGSRFCRWVIKKGDVCVGHYSINAFGVEVYSAK